LTSGLLLGPHLLELLGGRVAAIGVSALEELLCDLPMPVGAGELVGGLAVPIETEPGQAVQDRRDRLGRRALAVGVLDPEQKRAAGVPRIEPVEQRGPRAADVQIAGGRGGKTEDRFGHEGCFSKVLIMQSNSRLQ